MEYPVKGILNDVQFAQAGPPPSDPYEELTKQIEFHRRDAEHAEKFGHHEESQRHYVLANALQRKRDRTKFPPRQLAIF